MEHKVLVIDHFSDVAKDNWGIEKNTELLSGI